MAVTQTVPRFDVGIALTGISADPNNALVASGTSARTASLVLRKGDNVVVFTNRFVCEPTFSNGSPSRVGDFCQDVNGGLAEINVFAADNCTVVIDNFMAGTAAEVGFSVTKIVEGVMCNWRFEAFSADGTRTETYFYRCRCASPWVRVGQTHLGGSAPSRPTSPG